MNGQLALVEVDCPALGDLDETANFSLDFWRRVGDAFVGAPRADPETRDLPVAEILKDGGRETVEVVRSSSREGEIGDAEYLPQAVACGVEAGVRTLVTSIPRSSVRMFRTSS